MIAMTALPATEGVEVGATVGLWLPTATLWWREMVRFFRQRNRVAGALATPVVFWLFLGTGLNRSFQAAGGAGAAVGYREYFFPGMVVMMVLFTAVFSTISVIEDRREGFLQGVLVAPIPRLALVLGKVLGGASIALIQGAVLLALWPLVEPWPGLAALGQQYLGALAVLAVLGIGLTALGLCLAWPMDSTAGFHAVMNLLLFPMWFLSGAVFPNHSTTPLGLRMVMWLNPLTYGQAALAGVLSGGRVEVGSAVSWPGALAISAGFAVVMLVLATALVRRRRKDGLG
jgi:ABC-2 type transport system permease protein